MRAIMLRPSNQSYALVACIRRCCVSSSERQSWKAVVNNALAAEVGRACELPNRRWPSCPRQSPEQRYLVEKTSA